MQLFLEETNAVFRHYLVFIYAIFTLANQQKVLNQYNDNSKELASKIEEQQIYNDTLW